VPSAAGAGLAGRPQRRLGGPALPARAVLSGRLRAAAESYPCDIPFAHRDAEGEARDKRAAEIRTALGDLTTPPAVCAVPVRMQEAWLLSTVERLADPKQKRMRSCGARVDCRAAASIGSTPTHRHTGWPK
jgi:hypothetical protein